MIGYRLERLVSIVYRPTLGWLSKVTRIYNYLTYKIDPDHAGVYSGTNIDAVILVSPDESVSEPNSEAIIVYDSIRWPGQTAHLTVIALEDGSLWEKMTDDVPSSVDPGQPIIRGEDWKDDWLLSKRAKECEQLIGTRAKKLYLVKPLSAMGKWLHEQRLAGIDTNSFDFLPREERHDF